MKRSGYENDGEKNLKKSKNKKLKKRRQDSAQKRPAARKPVQVPRKPSTVPQMTRRRAFPGAFLGFALAW
jgi:hypothetical protein